MAMSREDEEKVKSAEQVQQFCRFCSICAVLTVVCSGVLLTTALQTQLRNGTAQLFTANDDRWCHLLVTKPIYTIVNVTVVENHRLASFNLGSIGFNNNGNYGINTKHRGSVQRCSLTGGNLTDDGFTQTTRLADYGTVMWAVAIGGWGALALLKICVLSKWVERVREMDFSRFWAAWVMFEAYINIVFLPTLLLFPLTSITALPNYPGFMTMNGNWTIWYVTLVLVVLGFIRWVAYIVCPCNGTYAAHFHVILALVTVLPVVFIGVAIWLMYKHLGWSVIFTIDIAVAIRWNLTIGIPLFATIFQKCVLFNIIVQTLAWLLTFILPKPEGKKAARETGKTGRAARETGKTGRARPSSRSPSSSSSRSRSSSWTSSSSGSYSPRQRSSRPQRGRRSPSPRRERRPGRPNSLPPPRQDHPRPPPLPSPGGKPPGGKTPGNGQRAPPAVRPPPLVQKYAPPPEPYLPPPRPFPPPQSFGPPPETYAPPPEPYVTPPPRPYPPPREYYF